MKDELDAKLCAAFPLLYADRHGDMKETLMCWGFPGDGWFDLIWRLSEKLEALIRAQPEDVRGKFRAFQVKEKFGGLRFYMTLETAEMTLAIQEAENESERTCEECGKPGESRSTGWVKVLCDEHYKERLAWREKQGMKP